MGHAVSAMKNQGPNSKWLWHHYGGVEDFLLTQVEINHCDYWSNKSEFQDMYRIHGEETSWKDTGQSGSSHLITRGKLVWEQSQERKMDRETRRRNQILVNCLCSSDQLGWKHIPPSVLSYRSQLRPFSPKNQSNFLPFLIRRILTF